MRKIASTIANMQQSARFQQFKNRLKGFWHQSSAWILGPICVGLIAVGLACGSEWANNINQSLVRAFPLAPLVFMPAGFALLAYLGQRFVAGSQGSGIPQTIAAINTTNGDKTNHLLSIRIAIGKSLLMLGGLSIGASIGREGPTVQIGASIMNSFHGRWFLQGEKSRRNLILAGAAAGIAAAFNAPLAGIMFAIEELNKKGLRYKAIFIGAGKEDIIAEIKKWAGVAESESTTKEKVEQKPTTPPTPPPVKSEPAKAEAPAVPKETPAAPAEGSEA